MKIWVVGRSYPQKSNNMQGSFELDQAKMLARHGHEVTYIACIFHPFKKINNWGFSDFIEDNVNIITYSQFYTIERMKLHFEPFKKRVWNKLLSYVEDRKNVPDIIHVHYPSNITVANSIIFYKKYGTKIICTEHWSQVLNNEIDNYERNQLKEYVYNSDVFFTVSYSLKEAVVHITNANNIEVLPNIVNRNFDVSDKKSNAFCFVALGALIKNKQFDKIIEAFDMAFTDQDNITLKIIGAGKEYKNLKNIVKEKNIQDKVSFEGLLSREETARKLSESDCLVSFSKYETFCVPIIEAWASGIPVIASDSISVNDKWDEKLGVKITDKTIKNLSNKMRYVFENYDIYDQKFIREYALFNYSEDSIYKKLINYYSR